MQVTAKSGCNIFKRLLVLCISVKSQRTDERLLILTKIVIAAVKIFYAKLSSWWRLWPCLWRSLWQRLWSSVWQGFWQRFRLRQWRCFLKVPVPLICDPPHHIPCFDDDDAFLGAGGFSANYSCHVVGWLGRLLGWSPPWKWLCHLSSGAHCSTERHSDESIQNVFDAIASSCEHCVLCGLHCASSFGRWTLCGPQRCAMSFDFNLHHVLSLQWAQDVYSNLGCINPSDLPRFNPLT